MAEPADRTGILNFQNVHDLRRGIREKENCAGLTCAALKAPCCQLHRTGVEGGRQAFRFASRKQAAMAWIANIDPSLYAPVSRCFSKGLLVIGIA